VFGCMGVLEFGHAGRYDCMVNVCVNIYICICIYIYMYI